MLSLIGVEGLPPDATVFMQAAWQQARAAVTVFTIGVAVEYARRKHLALSPGAQYRAHQRECGFLH